MKSDISRQTFDPRKHYSRVVMQQGRVQLDADWNEQQDINLHHLAMTASDIIGKSGVPDVGDGFKISFTPDGRDLCIHAGHIYVDGMLCELDEPTVLPATFEASDRLRLNSWQVDGRAFQKGQWIFLEAELSAPKQQVSHLGQLFQISAVDADQKMLTLLTDQATFKIGDFQKASNHRLRRIITYTTQPDYPNPPFTNSTSDLPELDLPQDQSMFLAYLDIWERDITALDDPHINEVALGGPDTATRIQALWQVKLQPIPLGSSEKLRQSIEERTSLVQEIAKLQSATSKSADTQNVRQKIARRYLLEQQDIPNALKIFTFTPPFSEGDYPAGFSPVTGKLNARISPPKGTSTGQTNGSYNVAYHGLENQLYHIEIHQGGEFDAQNAQDVPIFKWARDNASLLASVRVDGDKVSVEGSGQGGILGFAVGQYVEVVDTQQELHGTAGNLVKITRVDEITGQLTLDPPLVSDQKKIRLRLWNGTGFLNGSDSANQGTSQDWLPLEGGIEVQFLPGTYRSGNYWLLPARTSTARIDWPEATPQLPLGIWHRYTRLASLLHPQLTPLRVIEDCRKRFSTLTAEALHILYFNWRNDYVYNQRDLESGLLKDGFEIIFDAELDAEYIKRMAASMIVTLETATPGGNEVKIVNGKFDIGDNFRTITWRWHEENILPWYRKILNKMFDEDQHLVRVRITLKGRTLWGRRGNRHIYLDGQTFAIAGRQSDGKTARIRLGLPSGAGALASDFESWFYIKDDDDDEDEVERR